MSTRVRQVQIRSNHGRTDASDGADSAPKNAFALNTITGTALFLFTAPIKSSSGSSIERSVNGFSRLCADAGLDREFELRGYEHSSVISLS